MARKPKNNTVGYKTETVEEYLARGGKITVLPAGLRSEDLEPMGSPRGYGKRRKKKKDE